MSIKRYHRNKPKVTQINPQDNRGNLPPKVPSQQQENSAVNQEIKAADSQILLPICQQSPTQETLNELISLHAKQRELGSLLIQQQRKLNLPSKEPPVFYGNAFDYHAFTTAFDSVICENSPLNKDRLYFLDKNTAGKANEVVKGFLAVNSEHSYTEARKLFDQHFDNPVRMAQAYKSRLCNWPLVKDRDSVALQEFSDFLFRGQEAVRITGSISELDSNENLVHFSAKLPWYSGIKWCCHAYETRTSVSFSESVCFVKEEYDLANDPAFSPDALRRERRNHSKISTKENKPRRQKRTAELTVIVTVIGLCSI